MHDPLAVGALIDPEMLQFQAMHVVVELRGEYTYGMTLCDYRHHDPDNIVSAGSGKFRGEEANAEVAVAVDADRFWEQFLEVLGTYP